MSVLILYIQGLFRTCNHRMLTHSAKYTRQKAVGINLGLPVIS